MKRVFELKQLDGFSCVFRRKRVAYFQAVFTQRRKEKTRKEAKENAQSFASLR
jgi:hypothetical protein